MKILFLYLLLSAVGYARDEVNICLTMIVKNDEEVIGNCLSSAMNIVDCVSIYDAGSTDRTLQIIEQFMQETGTPGKIHKHVKHQNLEKDRSYVISSAQNTLKSKGFSLSNSYLLILDPETSIDVSSSFTKENLDQCSYLLPEKWPNLYRYSARLFRADNDWHLQDISYHSDSYKVPTFAVKNDEIKIIRGDQDLQREVSKLSQALEKTPNDRRLIFDFAQLNLGLKKYDEAIHFYKERISRGGDAEEIWFSKYMLGECYEEMGQWDQALYWYLDAYQFNPNRPESLQKISTYYRYHGQNDLSHIFAKYGTLFTANQDYKLIDPSYSAYKFEEDLSIVSYYTRFRTDGFIAASDLLIRRDAPWWAKELAAKNILYYVQNLQNARYKTIEIDLPLVEDGFDERFHPMNPSICKTEDGYKVICRSVNYTQTGAKIFNTIDKEGIYRTRNFLVTYDKDFNLLSQSEIDESLPRERTRHVSIVQGLEDCRIFEYDDAYWFTCTTRDGNPAGVPQIVLCRLDDESQYGGVDVDLFIPLLGPDLNRCEKNWLPFVKDDVLQMIYSEDPFVIYQPNLETGMCELFLEYIPDYDFSRFRGSAAPIAFDGGYLMLVHEVCFLNDSSRVYLHRFVYLDTKFEIKKISRPFTFTHQGVEFCCSMTLDHSEKDVIMTVGLEDNQALICSIDTQDVRSLLLSLENHAD